MDTIRYDGCAHRPKTNNRRATIPSRIMSFLCLRFPCAEDRGWNLFIVNKNFVHTIKSIWWKHYLCGEISKVFPRGPFKYPLPWCRGIMFEKPRKTYAKQLVFITWIARGWALLTQCSQETDWMWSNSCCDVAWCNHWYWLRLDWWQYIRAANNLSRMKDWFLKVQSASQQWLFLSMDISGILGHHLISYVYSHVTALGKF